MQPQGELDLQHASGCLPVLAEQAADAFQALGDGVDVDVEFVLGAHGAHAAGEIRLQGADEVRAPAVVVGGDPAYGAVHEPGDVTLAGQEKAEEPEVLGGGAVAGAAEQAQGLQAALGLGVGGRGRARVGGQVADGRGGAHRDRLVDGGAQVPGGAAGQFRRGGAALEGQQENRAAVAGGGEAVPGGGQVGGGRPQPAAGVGLLLRVGGGSVEAGGEDDVRGVQVGVQPGGALAQQAGVAVTGVQEIVEEFAADALLGLGGGAAGEQEQGGDHRGALQGALVDGVETAVAAEHECAEQFAARGDGGDPVVAVAHRVSFGPGRLQGVGGCRGGFAELDGAVLQDLGDGGCHVVDSAAAQDQFGEAVVDVGGAFDDGAAVADDLVGAFQAGEGGAGLGEQVGAVDGGRGEGGEGAEQGDLLPFEDPGPAVGGEQYADDVRAEHERDAEDGDQSFVLHARVDGAGVLEPGVLEVVVGDVRAGRLGDQAAESFAHAQAQLLEAGGHRALGDPHVGVLAGGVVEREVGDVGAEERPGALHDGLEHRVEVSEAGQVVGGLEQGRQFGLAASASFQFRAYAQGEQFGVVEGGDPLGGPAFGAGEQHRLFVGGGGCAAGQQFEERGARAAVGRGCGAGQGGGAGRRARVGGGAPGGLRVIAGHAHRIPHRPVVRRALWKTPFSVTTVQVSGRSSRRRGPASCR